MITTTQLCIIMIIYLVVIVFLLIVLATTNEKIVRQMDDIEKRVNNATTMCEIIKIWDDYEKLYKDSWHRLYDTRLNRIKDMILTKLDSFRNSSTKQS